MSFRIGHRAVGVVMLGALLTACGQKGPLYLPDTGGEVVTRPASATQGTPQQSPQQSPQQASPETAPQPSTTTPESTTTKPEEKKNPPR